MTNTTPTKRGLIALAAAWAVSLLLTTAPVLAAQQTEESTMTSAAAVSETLSAKQ